MAPLHCLFVFAALLLAPTDGLPSSKTKGVPKTKCQRYHALKRFSACGAVVGHAVREKSLLENPNHNATCQKAQGFDKCFQDSMRLTRCVRSSEFNFHLQHISSLVNEMYKETCSSSGETSSMLTDMSTVCDIRVAVVRFLECTSSFYIGEPQTVASQNHSQDVSATTRGVHFGVIFDAPAAGGAPDKYSRLPSIECRRSAKFRNCIDNIHLYSECGIGTEVHSHLKYLANIVTRKVAGKCSQQTQIPDLDCQLLPFLRKFLHCGVNRYETTGDRVDHDICTQVLSYKECVAAAERVTHCNMRNLSLSYHLTYLHKVMTNVNTSCNGVRNVETSVYKETCKRTTLFNNYFSCGMEVQARLEGLKKGDKERCRISQNFEKCFINAKEQSGCLLADEATSIMSALLDTWKKEHAKECSDFDVTPPRGAQVECLTGTAVRKVFLCGLSFQTAVREVKFSPLEMSPEVCRRLEEMNTCISEVKSRTQCAMSELHAHVAPLLQPFTTDYAKRCEKIVWSNMSAPMMSPNSPACRRLPALKRIFHCGLSFSRILEEMELVHQKAEVLCPLLKKYETCVPDSASELGCKDDPVMKGHVRSFGRILHKQYYEACLRSRRGPPVRLQRWRRGKVSNENGSRDILGNVNMLKQELKRGGNVSAAIKQQMLSQVMEDYYGPDYDEYVEEEDKVPDSLDVKPAYDYADREATSKTRKQDAPQRSAQLSPEGIAHNSSMTRQKQDGNTAPRKNQEFWAGVERARKLRSQHRYESGSPELVQDLNSKGANRDFGRPGAYFIDQLGNPPDYNRDNYARNKDEAQDSDSKFISQPLPENFRNSPVKLPIYKSMRNVPRAARQGERDAEGWRGLPPLSREEELEMYEDTRGMTELLQKQRERHYSRYKGRDNLSPKSDMQRAGKDPAHRYAVSGDEVSRGGFSNVKGSFNRSLAYYDYNGGTDTRRFRADHGMRHIERYPYIRHYGPNERTGKEQQDERRHKAVQLDRRVIGLQRRGHAYKSTDYDLSEYEKPALAHLPHMDGEEELVSRDVVSFPEDDAPVLPNDESLSQDVKQMGPRRAISVRRRDNKAYPDAPRNLQVALGMGDVNYAPDGTFSLSDSVSGAKLPRHDGADALTEEKDQMSQNHRQGAPLPYYPRRLASNMFRARAGLPTDPRSAVGIMQEDYDRGVKDYNKASLKISDGPPASTKEEMPPRLNAMKRLSAHDRIPSPNNPNFQAPGETSGNVRSFQRKPPFKKPSYKEIGPHEMDSYPDELRPFPSPSQRHSNDSNYVGPNSFLPEPGLRSPKEKVVPDFLGETKERAALPEARPRKDELSHRRSVNSPGSRMKDVERERDFNDGQEGHEEGFVQQGAKGQKRFFDIKKRRREPRLGFPYVRHIDESPGLLLDKNDEAAGSAIPKPPRQNTNLQLNQYELERKMRKKLVKDDLEEIISKHKEESDSKADMMLFPNEHLVRDDRVVRDFDGKALEENKDYYELDAKLESDSGDRSSMWSAGRDDIKEELLRKHIEGTEKRPDPLLGELSKRNAWYTDDIWSDNNDLFGMERLLSDQRRDFADNVTDEDEMSQCHLHNLQRRSAACVRVFEDDFKAVGNGTARHFEVQSLTPQIRKSVCSHARDFSQCINLFAQKYRCVDSQELIKNLTDDHLKKTGVMFCDSSTVRISFELVIAAVLLHFLRM
ncbi:uncharacterized protein [Dermacentor albipictus]|uniref:uncharacterized protein n=1 Tax=Dermacentor albipictus TaxID=60249 RepID=UPI0038FC04AB